MKRKNVYLIFISIFFHVSCSSHSKDPEESKGNGLYVFDIDKAKKNSDEVFLYSSLYKKVSVIPLETNESCLIGNISKIRVFDRYIFVLDFNKAKSLFVFDREGHFIRKIGNTGNGPGEFIEPVDFTIDRDNKTVYVLDIDLQRINKYDIATGNFIQAINLEKEVRSFNIEHVEGKLYADAIFRKHADNNYLLRVIQESTGKEERHYLNVMEYTQGISNLHKIQSNIFYFRENGNPVFVQQFMPYVIEINKDSIFSLVELKGRDVSITSEKTDELNEMSVMQHVLENRELDKYHSILSFIEKGNIILMDIQKGRFFHKLLIHKKTKEVYVLENFNDDLLFKDGVIKVLPAFGCSDASGVYYIVNSHIISMYQAWAKEDILSPDLGRLEDLKNLEEDANPVILYYEFKD
ncbi:MAG: 6-bladed beta-propeller [Tannerella sp.]|jgi:hypothetical protein|nr:6-bladed beta-propeller [Tannerella sp.]